MSWAQSRARLIALLLPLLLLAGAWGSQLIGGLVPCEMCHWQRWPHYAAVLAAAFAFVVPGRSSKVTMIVIAALLIAVSGLIGVFHAGVEYHWWQGITACSTMVTGDGVSTDEMLRRLLAAPVIRCDAAQWTLVGVSLAGFNAILSLGGAAVILWLIGRVR
ncbi:disulfide bond formation protein B [Sphingomonas mucosissima]|uniref:Disulfide bond formation protein B n=1 Tax=Sphingomonas mucosissima TaxID=370959 RepID=A0A245ZQS6_9SPHN|nr:disulfide bond formation protein B [Sphingomonas mucosissima]OWK32097.1 disulfide bond formation protein B [Sphingomonas mucosissima]